MTDDLFSDVRAQIIGEGIAIQTPYGVRRLTYADHAASGRAYAPIEDFIRGAVLPTYGNPHTETSRVGAQTTAFREEARKIIRESVGAGPDDAVIFAGSGTTGAVAKLVGVLGIALPCKLEDRYALRDAIPPAERPVVFIGTYEHHSNELPWRETIADVVVVNACRETGIDLDDLSVKLRAYADRPLKIGSFSAASNVTGTLTDVKAIARLLHNQGALALFDYAAAGPAVDVQMNPPDDPLAYKDAVFMSVHKFAGGPGTPGVLVAKKHLFGNRVPAVPGGGTVSYASPRKHWYLADVERREEGGTPDVVGSIRAGLAFQLKGRAAARAGGPDALAERERGVAAEALAAWRGEPNLVLLGDLDAPRLSTVSFMVRCGQRALHHGFVVALLNDLFGIQARGGCSCAAPFGQRLLGIDDAAATQLEEWIKVGWNGVRPGWARVSFGWYDSPASVRFVVDAVRFVAREGWRFLADYTFDGRVATWRHCGERPALQSLALAPAVAPVEVLPEEVRPAYLAEAVRLAALPRSPTAVESVPYEALRWHWLPGETPQ